MCGIWPGQKIFLFQKLSFQRRFTNEQTYISICFFVNKILIKNTIFKNATSMLDFHILLNNIGIIYWQEAITSNLLPDYCLSDSAVLG